MKKQGSVFRINQEGFVPGLPIHAVLLTDGEVRLKDPEGKTVYTVPHGELREDAASGDRVRLAEIPPLAEGKYTLESGEEQREFAVRARGWREVSNALIKGLYFQRCGCALESAHAGVYHHPACHTAPAVGWDDRTLVRRVPGGWHDAGDYGKYTGPGAVTAAHMIYAWKLFPQGCSDELNIPESGNGLPDILNEVKYELDWLLEMQRSDGAFYHKLTKAQFAPFIMPQDDLETEYLMPVSHCATAAACACMALAARVWQGYSPAFANRAVLAAKRAWDWLQAHPDFVPYRNPEGVRTGWYGDMSDRDERFWAACELYAATGEENYRTEAEKLYGEGLNLTAFGWADVSGMGALCCLFELKEKGGEVLYGRVKEDFLQRSEQILQWTKASGYGTALPADRYGWGSILPIMSGAIAMIINWLLTGNEKMRDGALQQWHYALGMNALDLCFITGYGTHRVMHPHHRPSGSDGIEDPVPGLIAGGPNGNHNYPQTKEKLEGLPPAKCYLDELPSADTNEIAIYWNSPAIFTGAFVNQIST
ncbi:MAG: glycoside hydrolase family 9 protein [Clostridia bacterium]|nr:glycoside hydrolase family 9 protein [Clostridia bacterium]